MINKIAYFVLGALLLAPFTAYALATFIVPQGGTGAATFSAGQVLYGANANSIKTEATGTVTCAGAASCGAGSYVLGNALTITGTAGSGLSTTSPVSAGNVLVYNSTGGGSAFGAATTTLTGTGVVNISNAPSVLGSSGAVASLTGGSAGQVLAWLSGAATWTATSTFATSSPASGGWGFNLNQNAFTLTIPIAGLNSTAGLLSATDWNTFNSKQASGNYITALTTDVTASGPGSVAATIAANAVTYAKFQQVAANSVVGNPTSATANAQAIGTSTLFTYSAAYSQSGGVQHIVEHRSFTYATSTAVGSGTGWTGTTTIPLETGYGETWNSIRCFTDAGTIGVDFYHSSSHLDYIPTASTTNNTNLFSTNNIITVADKTYVDLGTPASSPTKINCTITDTL